ncbi:hypothetical protein DMA11_09660 [Marinilabiliaceae bacterium JC017]|nr:hypothetical protein DMA11_09660 [Marinilabiliaceae bacterium JC017]
MRRKSNSIFLFVLVTVCGLVLAQNASAQQDTIYLNGNSDTYQEVSYKAEKIHSPHKATFYSAILPGLGQAYNKKYWKIPILYAGIGALGYAIHFNTKYYTDYKAAYRDFVIQDPNNTSYMQFVPDRYKDSVLKDPAFDNWFKGALKNKKDYYKRYRDLSYIGMVAVYVLNLIDASVDAHFYNYDISDDLSLRVEPVMMDTYALPNSGMGLQLRLKF